MTRRGLRHQTHLSESLGASDPRRRRQGQAWLSKSQEDNRTVETTNGRLSVKIHPASIKYLLVTDKGIFLDLQAISDDLP